MKTQMLGIAVFVIALLAVSSAVAQGTAGDVLVNVPFSFVAGSHSMPAGRYIVRPVKDGIIRMYAIQGSNKSVFLGVHSVESPKRTEPKVVFHRYRDSYFLAQVWTGNGEMGRELPTSKAEKELASLKLSGPRPEGEIAVVRPER